MSSSVPETREFREKLASFVETGDLSGLPDIASELHASDVADLLENLDEDRKRALLSALPIELASEALAEMDEGLDRAELLASLDPSRSAKLLQELADDDAADLIGELGPDERQRILEELPTEEAGDLRGLLQYDEETAGGLMTTELVSVQSTMTAAEAIERVRIKAREVGVFYQVFVVDPRRRLLGTVALDRLVTAEPNEPIESLVDPMLAKVLPDVDQEEVGRLMARYNLVSIPVVNEFDVLLGRITFDDVLDVIEAEQTEDIFRLAGVSREEEFRSHWSDSVRVRLPWLILNLVTATISASVILLFSATIADNILLAFLAPIVAALGGSSGTQSLAITVRGLALHGEGSLEGLVQREFMVGLVNGAVLGGGIAAISLLAGADPLIGLAVLLAMWGNQMVAVFAGAYVPTTLHRLGVDPSVASSVFVQTLTDLTGFFLLLSLATKLLL